jgi:hypothetical protein
MSSVGKNKNNGQGYVNHVPPAFKSRLVQLPGEFLQVQLEA